MPKPVFLIFLGSSFLGILYDFNFFFIRTYIPFPYLFQTPVASEANILIIMRAHMNTG